jgi:iron(III) transport system ATP-binding protein
MSIANSTSSDVATAVPTGRSVLVEVRDLVKSYGDSGRGQSADPVADAGDVRVRAVDGVSFDIEAGEMFTLLGPSGCGKTTMLRSIAGLEKPDSGAITVAGRAFFDGDRRVNVPVNQRGLGMVFQSYAIWPHMSVRQNVAFPMEIAPRKQRLGRKAIAEEVDRLLGVTGLSGYADRRATKLSGGQQQRLALARALVIRPPLLLLDEPLSNLDAKLRESMRFELKRMQRDLGITSIYVTHDQAEALALSNRVAVMNRGTIAQIGRPRDIYERPASRFVAEFIGTTNFVNGTVERADGGEVTVIAGGVRFVARSAGAVRQGQAITLSVRPENVTVGRTGPASEATNTVKGRVLARAYMGDSVDHEIAVGDMVIRSKGNPSLSIPADTDVVVRIAPDNLVVVAGDLPQDA